MIELRRRTENDDHPTMLFGGDVHLPSLGFPSEISNHLRRSSSDCYAMPRDRGSFSSMVCDGNRSMNYETSRWISYCDELDASSLDDEPKYWTIELSKAPEPRVTLPNRDSFRKDLSVVWVHVSNVGEEACHYHGDYLNRLFRLLQWHTIKDVVVVVDRIIEMTKTYYLKKSSGVNVGWNWYYSFLFLGFAAVRSSRKTRTMDSTVQLNSR